MTQIHEPSLFDIEQQLEPPTINVDAFDTPPNTGWMTIRGLPTCAGW